MSLLMAITWGLLGLLIGSLAFFLFGLVVSQFVGHDLSDKIGRWYVDMAMATLSNVALVVRETGQLTVKKTRFDPKFEGDHAVIDGVGGHWKDPLEVKSTLSGKPFGIGLESASCYISPLSAELGKKGSRLLEEGKIGVDQSDGEEKVWLDYEIPKESTVLDLRSAATFLQGSCKRRWGKLANKWGELSQEGFHERISMSQSLLWIAGFAVGVGLAFLVIGYGPDDTSTTVPIQTPIAFAAVGLFASTEFEISDEHKQIAAVVLGTVGVVVLTTIVAALGWGLISGVLFFVGVIVGCALPWFYVRVMMSPFLSGQLGSAFLILAQLTFGVGVIVRRDDGVYEWCKLNQDESETTLSDGRTVKVDVEPDELPTIAWAPIAIVEQKTEKNMSGFIVDDWRKTRPDPKQHGTEVKTPLAIADGGEDCWHVDSSKLERWARGSAGNGLPRSGLRKALEEEGGQQRISQFVTMIGTGVLMVVGFVSTALVMMI